MASLNLEDRFAIHAYLKRNIKDLAEKTFEDMARILNAEVPRIVAVDVNAAQVRSIGRAGKISAFMKKRATGTPASDPRENDGWTRDAILANSIRELAGALDHKLVHADRIDKIVARSALATDGLGHTTLD